MEGKHVRLVAVDHLIQFAECAIHLVLRRRELYPADTFVPRKRLGVTVYMSKLPNVQIYIKQLLKSVRDLVLFDRVNAFIVRIPEQNQIPAEQFTIELPADFGRTIFYGVPATSNKTEFEIACVCAELLGAELKALERKLNQINIAACFRTWEFFLDIKRADSMNDSLDIPVGYAKLSQDEENRARDCSRSERTPLKSTVMNEHVLVSMFFDIVR
jgi:hypothetical protein